MKVDSIRNGIVIDHINAGRAMEIYKLLGLDSLDCSVALIKNVPSRRMVRKDIIKIDSDFDLDINALGFVDPEVTVNIIRDGVVAEKARAASQGACKCGLLQKSPLHNLHRAGA